MRFKNGNGKCPDFSFCAKVGSKEECSIEKSKNCWPVENGKPESKLHILVLRLLFKERWFKNEDERVEGAVTDFLKTSGGERSAADRIIDDAVSSFSIRKQV